MLNAGTIGTMKIGPNHLVVGDNLAGYVNVLGNLGSLTVAGGTPGSIAAGTIGTVAVYGGYGPIVAQIKEDGIQRQINATSPNYPYAAPNPAALPSPSSSSYVNFEYFYEGLATGLGNPQLTARVTNGVGTSADQYDFALITDNDVAKFNLARLDAVGVAGVRNVEVEGDLLTTITAAAQAFFGLAEQSGRRPPPVRQPGRRRGPRLRPAQLDPGQEHPGRRFRLDHPVHGQPRHLRLDGGRVRRGQPAGARAPRSCRPTTRSSSRSRT